MPKRLQWPDDMKLKFSDILLSSDKVLLNNFILKLISKKIIPFHMKVEDEMLLVTIHQDTLDFEESNNII